MHVASRRRGVVATTRGKFRRIGGNACGIVASWRRVVVSSWRRGVVAMTRGKFRRIGENVSGLYNYKLIPARSFS